jgi:hypothetical protein
MICLPFTKKAQARDMALEQLRPLLALQRLPTNFWNQAYAVSFIFGYVEAVTRLLVGDQKATLDYVSDVQTGVLSALVSHDMESMVQRLVSWRGTPETVEGIRNGKFIAMFLHGDRNADATELAVEAFRQAHERAPVFDQLKAQTNERGRAAIILCEILFFDKINGSPATNQRPIEPVRKAEPEAPPSKKWEPLRAPAGPAPQVSDLYSRVRAELEAGGDELGVKTIAALNAERRNGGINDVIEAEIFAKLFSDDQEKLGGNLAIKDVVEASIHASIVFKFTTKEITEPQMYAQLDAARGKFTKHDVTEAEIFAKSIGELEAERGKLTGKDIMEAKMFAKFFARALAKVRAEPEVDTSAQTGPTFRVGTVNAQALPPSHGNIWLDGDELWLSTPSKDFSFDGRAYHIPGGAICFPKHKIGREALLKTLRAERDLWAPGDEDALNARLIQRAEQSRS